MDVRQGFVMEHGDDYRPAFAAAEFGAERAVLHARSFARPFR